MKKETKKRRAHRILSMMLACVMVLTMLSPASVEAAEATLTTNKDTYEQGEGILVTATSTTPGDWVGLYKKGEDPSPDTVSYYWYYVNGTDSGTGLSWSNGETYNIFLTANNPDRITDNKGVPVGEYEVILMTSNYDIKERKTITVTEPEKTDSSLEAENTTVNVGEPVRVKATSYNEGAWIGVYTGKRIDADGTYLKYYYVNGINKTYVDISGLAVGDYTIVLTTDSGYTVDKYVHVTVEEAKEELLITDKEEYKFGEPIMVTTNYGNPAGWVGLYKKNDVPGEGSGTSTSLFYEYIQNEAYNLIGKNPQRESEFVAGDYKVVLFADSGYTAIAEKYITITKEITKTDKIEPTCEKDGSITYTYTDGTKEVVTAAEDETLKATGHAYGEWEYNQDRTHSKKCGNDEAHVVTEKCEFGEPEITKEATATEKGEKTYTCKVCKGTYTEEYSAATVVKTETIKEATCEEDGTLRTYYSDNTHIDTVIPKLEHTYPDTWTYDRETKTHKKVCTNDEKHVLTEECNFNDGEVTGTTITYTCSGCEGTYTEPVLQTDKTEYKYGDPINVTVKKYNATDAWVGLYKKGETYNPDTGGVKSIFWYYLSEQKNPVNILETRDENDRSSEYKAGEYTIVLFKDGGYTPYCTVDIEVTTEIDESKTVRVEPTCEKDGSITYTYTDGTKEVVTAAEDETLKATGHAYGEWEYNQDRTHSKKCGNDESHVVTEKCEFGEPEITKEATATEKGEKTYTCKVCKGTYTEEYSVATVVKTETIKEATCEEDGTLRTYYSDNTHIDTVIPKLEHTYPDTWTYDKETKKHVKVCGNDNSHVIKEECSFSKEMKDGKFVYTCKDCKGSYEESVIRTDKKKYDIGEPIEVTVDYEFGATDWVGIYKKGEVPNSGGIIISFYYYYPQDSGKTLNIYDAPFHQRGEMEPGEYTIFLCANDGWDVIASVDVTLGHEFGTWKYDKDAKTHSRTCDGSMKHQEGPVACTFESKVTKEPTATETGIKTFTCSVCSGTYEEVIPATSATIVDTKTIEATCETEGKVIITYSDGTVKEEILKKLGHNYDEENCTFNEADKTHTAVCKNDSSHVKTTNCTFDRVAMEGDKATYKCSVCGGTFEAGLLYVAKDTYSASEDINVMASCSTDGSWVGLYKIDDEYGENATVSLYWYYVVSGDINRDGKTVNLTDNAFYNIERTDGMTPGEYKIILFGDSGYSKVLAQENITITESTTTYDMKINGEEVSDGDIKQFKDDDKINVTVTAKGNPGKAWVGIYTAHYTKDTDFSAFTSADWYYVADNNAKPVSLNTSLREPGDYSIVIFGNSGYDDVKQIVYYTFTKDGAENVIIEPTCTKPGIKYVVYDDGSDAYIPIAKLGHDVKAWTYDAETKTHSGVCERIEGDTTCGEKVTEDCKFEVVEDKDGVITYSCTVCNGQYSEAKEEVIPPYEEKEDRIYGDTRYTTATEIAEQLKKDQNIEKFNTIIIASGTGYADALSGTYLAKVKNAPILLVDSKSNKIMKSVADYVNANLAEGGTVYILGGTKAISDTFLSSLKVDKNHIKRIGGATRYETNILILKEAGVTGNEILVCTGNNFADSLSASALGRPVLLVNNKNLLKEQKTFLNGMKGKKFFIIGGKNAIGYDMEELIRDYGGTERISGATRYETSVKLAERFFEAPKSMILAYGEDFPDGLAGGMLAIINEAPLLLAEDASKTCVADYAKDNNIVSGKVLGGTTRISEEAVKSIFGVSEDK